MNEYYVANVKNWLMDIATGAKAMKEPVQFAPCEDNKKWKVTASCYNRYDNGIAIHGLKQLAESIDVRVNFVRFGEDTLYRGDSVGYCYFEMFGVKFYDLISKENIPDEWK